MNNKKEKIKACIAIGTIIIAILIVGIISMKYSVEGEKNLPFKLSKITIVSTAEGVENTKAEEKWNLNIYQNNDLYFSVEKNENAKDDEKIGSIEIENIEIIKVPLKGEIKAYMPNSIEGRTFSYDENYIINENKLTYKGALKTNTKTLEIGNQGGTVPIRFSNVGIGNYISNDDVEIKHDGSMLSKLKTTIDELKFTVNFDFIINLKNKSYKTNITIDLPCSDSLIEEGTCSKEITDEFVFKRVNK